jgi:hypothetical protein
VLQSWGLKTIVEGPTDCWHLSYEVDYLFGIRATSQNYGLKCFMLLGRSTPLFRSDIIKGKELAEAGSDFIHKPFTPKDLLIRVREILDR